MQTDQLNTQPPTLELTTKPIIELCNVGVCLGGNWVHRNLSLKILPNKIISIIGDSGCGKTTLLREILMLQPIDEGEIYINNKQVTHFDLDSTNTKILLSQVGVMFQQGALFSSLTALENVMFPLVEYTDFSIDTITNIARLKLQLVGLSEKTFDRYPKELSGGMLKRVAVARALALDPQIIFLDEPTSGLDPNSASKFDELIQQLQQQLHLTVIMITHDLDSIWHISDEVVYLGNKQVLFHDSVIRAAKQDNIQGLYEYFNGKRGLIWKDYYTATNT